MNFKLLLVWISTISFLPSIGLNASEKSPSIQLHLIQVPGDQLPIEAYPDLKIKVSKVPMNEKRFLHLKHLTEDFSKNGDRIISEVFGSSTQDRKLSIQVVATSGIPEPYDAWTAELNGVYSIIFNLSIWNESKMKRSGLGIIKHEVTHVLLKPLLKNPALSDFNAALNYIVINEGIAHFIGHPDRLNLLTTNKDNWDRSEQELANAQLLLKDPKISQLQKEELLKKSNTGSFWKKYGAISGMFRAASIYREHGAKGLVDAISKSRLEKPVQ